MKKCRNALRAKFTAAAAAISLSALIACQLQVTESPLPQPQTSQDSASLSASAQAAVPTNPPAWNADTLYGRAGLYVTHKGKVWVSQWYIIRGAEPGANTWNGWKSIEEPSADKDNPKPWSADIAYTTKGYYVTHKHRLYVSQWSITRGTEPGADTWSGWKDVTPPLRFASVKVRKSKMLVITNGSTDQTYTNTLISDGTPLSSGAAYSIIDKPVGITSQITVDADSGEVTFGKAAYDKVSSDGPQTVTVQAAYQGKTASYTFTVTDHFSGRDNHTSVVSGKYIYVIGGSTDTETQSNEVWRSQDGGLTFDQTAAPGRRFTARTDHGSVVLKGRTSSDPDTLYVIGGGSGRFGVNPADDVWKSVDGGKTWSIAQANAPFTMDYQFASAVLNNSIILMGGFQMRIISFPGKIFRLPRRINDVYQSSNGASWTKPSASGSLFSARSDAASVVLEDEVYLLGGWAPTRLNDVWKSSDGASWTEVNSDSAGTRFPRRYSHSAVVQNGAMYVIGGMSGTSGLSTPNLVNDVWKSTDKGVNFTQVTANADFSTRSDHTSVVQGDAMYVIGGFSNRKYQNDVWKSTDGGLNWVNVHKNP